MIILGIETSCDETALSLIEASGGIDAPRFKTIATSLYSQIKIHEQYGGVFPMIAKREHSNNLVPLFDKLINDAKFSETESIVWTDETKKVLEKIFDREPELLAHFLKYFPTTKKPKIDLIAVTHGPGLEPALWVGINFAKALSYIWNIPVIATNHMEGHLCSVLLNETKSEILNPKSETKPEIQFPMLGLLISGGHTELVLSPRWGEYKVLGETRDDAIGEAFDKVARLLGLPYPGGPEISKLAEAQRKLNIESEWKFPRPMLHSDNFDFSFAGLKTSVLYTIKKIPEISAKIRSEMALEFENAVTEVLTTKTKKAIEKYKPKTLVIGGGVVANKHIRNSFEKLMQEFPLNAEISAQGEHFDPQNVLAETKLLIPEFSLATDNAVMIAMAGYLNHLQGKTSKPEEIVAKGNLHF